VAGSPAQVGSVPADPAARHRWRTVALVAVTVFAVTGAIAAGSGAWVAAGRAGDAADQARRAAEAAAGGATPTVGTDQQPTDAPTQPTVPADPNATTEPRLDERTTYEPKYQKETLTLSARCNYEMYADVDEPRADVENTGWDIAFTGGCGAAQPPKIRLGERVAGSTAGSRDSTPADCVENIRQSPVGSEVRVPARQGAVICLNTSFAAARTRGDQWRIVRIEIISADDNTTRLEAYAWNIR
jgi:hypothetical protein